MYGANNTNADGTYNEALLSPMYGANQKQQLEDLQS